MIRTLQPEDCAYLQPLCASISKGMLLETELARSLSRSWVALQQTPTIRTGFCLCWEIGDEWELVALGAQPPFRRQGIGRTLLRYAVAGARVSRARRITLEVAANNESAIALYESEGFRRFNTRRNYYRGSAGQPARDAWELELLLDAKSGNSS